MEDINGHVETEDIIIYMYMGMLKLKAYKVDMFAHLQLEDAPRAVSVPVRSLPLSALV